LLEGIQKLHPLTQHNAATADINIGNTDSITPTSDGVQIEPSQAPVYSWAHYISIIAIHQSPDMAM